MSIPGYRARTAANSKALADSASRVGKATVPPGLPTAQEVVIAIDGVLQCENFYSATAQDALARLVIVREQFERARQTPPTYQQEGSEALEICHQAHAVMTLQLAQLEKLANEIKRAAVRYPHQPLSRWVKFGPMAPFLASIKDLA